ncbi:phosphoribosylaminoimidazole-succinocarboxamide synthase [Phyllosticta citrichinensis]|uniref:Phosphoribosylaminoimidazole-succinocarboxamide synthase n=1 Tax=Phyllosticta citrichinensis TaxID=1130410 RepID=A0ABR1XF82_9PEZI
MAVDAVVSTNLEGKLHLVARGKVRDVYELDSESLLFVATDRISAYDVIMKNGIPQKGALLTALSSHWFTYLSSQIPSLRTHFLSSSLPPSIQLDEAERAQLARRSMRVRRLQIYPIEAIVRGYITGSAWAEYRKTGTVHGAPMPEGLRESEELPEPVFTPSTKAEVGGKDENISKERAAEIIGADAAKKIEQLSLDLYKKAAAYARSTGIIIADTKFEFGYDAADPSTVILVDEVLTPDSSRFWPADAYAVGKTQDSFDKQFLRDWLTREGLKGKEGVAMPPEIVQRTHEKYVEAYERLTGSKWQTT